MIIQSARLSTGTNLPQLTGHVFAGAANDAITVLHGAQDDLDAMRADAAAAGKAYAIRHFKIAPAETTDRVEAAIGWEGIILQPGDNAGVWLAYAHAGGQAVKLGALHRLLQVPRAQVHAVISAEDMAPAAAM